MIYFVQAEKLGYIKIGFTTNWRKRAIGLRGACPDTLNLLAMHEGSVEDEKELHERFREWHHRGEWFEPAEDLLDYISDYKHRILAVCSECGDDIPELWKPDHNFFCIHCSAKCPETNLAFSNN